MSDWNLKNKKTVYKNPFFSVSEDTLTLSDGTETIYYILHKNDFVSVIAFENDYIYFIKIHRYTLGKESLELPMGGIDKGEDPQKAALRELSEEVGIIGEKIKKIGELDSFKGQSNQKCHVFMVWDLKETERNLDKIERESGLEVLKINISDIPNMMKKGEISDLDTIASFYLFMLNYRGDFNK